MNRAKQSTVEPATFTWSLKLALLWILIASFYGPGSIARTVTYFYVDHQGTVLAAADANGVVTSSTDYRPYGVLALGGGSESLGYTGHVKDDDVGLIYMQARYYDSRTGRFLSVDPIAPSASDLFGIGRYTYGSNNPVLRTDPSGMSDECSAACRKLRQLSDSMGISGALKSAVRGGSGPMGQANASLRTLNGGLETAASQQMAAVAPAADLLPGATAAACVSGEACSASDVVTALASLLPVEMEAAEIVAINRMFVNGGIYRSAETVIANMAYREGSVEKAAVAIRDIAGGHLFHDGNSRTAQVVAERILGGRVDPTKIRGVVDAASDGRLRTVEDISHALQH
ncbi:RHS repeat-associated core domain-containing protein [Luteibacter sp. Lutesp34]|uniref:RHS repeat-associated core domain-containing protein n=1 Tax=Luteibacter sp. Lutesp34 TaxID=3243030 RepID=UPI0039B40711